MIEDGVVTATSIEQTNLQDRTTSLYQQLIDAGLGAREELDVRGCYTAMAMVHMLSLDKFALAEQAGMVQYVKRCQWLVQTYEGGLGGEPGNEAHGAYTFCGLTALVLINQAHQLDLPRLIHWAAHMQGSVQGGFMGCTNKLVDGCYSFWQDGLFPLLQTLMPDYLSQTSIPFVPMFASSAATTTAGSGSSGGTGVAVAEEAVRQLEARSPEQQALDDLFRTKERAESAAEATAAAEEASRAAAAADSQDAAELHRKAQEMLTASTLLQHAVQRSSDNLDTVTAYAAEIYTSVIEDPAEQSAQSAEDPWNPGMAAGTSPCSSQSSRSPLLYNA